MRLIGAPCRQNTLRLVDNMMPAVDFTRHQAYYLKDKGFITYAEADSCPGPRYIVPASHMETFNTALLADGSFRAIHKYTVDYFSHPGYDTG